MIARSESRSSSISRAIRSSCGPYGVPLFAEAVRRASSRPAVAPA